MFVSGVIGLNLLNLTVSHLICTSENHIIRYMGIFIHYYDLMNKSNFCPIFFKEKYYPAILQN